MSDGPAPLAELLARLEDVAVPEPVSWWPQTPAWAVLAILVIALLVFLATWGFRRWRANRYRREALADLARIESRLAEGDPAAGASVAALLRRVALHIAPREHVAALGGDDWLCFLDERVRGSAARFEGPVGQRLLEVAYAPQRSDERAADSELVSRARHWIRKHRA